MASPAFRINGGAVGAPASVSASGTVTATLDSIVGVNRVTWSVMSTDDTRLPSSYTLTPSGSIGQTVTLTAGAAGTAGILRCVINAGLDLQTGAPSAATAATGKWYVPTSNGFEVIAGDETLESDSRVGWGKAINAALRAAGDAVESAALDALNLNDLSAFVSLADSSETITLAQGRRRHLPASTLTQRRTKTLSTTGAVQGDTIQIVREDKSTMPLDILVGSTLLFSLGGPGVVTAKFDGTTWKLDGASRPNGSRVVNIKDFGAIGDGAHAAEDTAAFQSALNLFSNLSVSGTIHVPVGDYTINSTLLYRGTSGSSIHIVGEVGPTFAPQGSMLRWVGSAGGTMVKFRGAVRCVVKNMDFYGTDCLYAFHLTTDQPAGGSGSTGCQFERCLFAVTGATAGNACFALGDIGNTQQCDLTVWRDCAFTGGGTPGTVVSSIVSLGAGNTKTFRAFNCNFVGTQYGFDWNNASGSLMLDSCAFASVTVACVRQGGENVVMRGCHCEGCGPLIVASSGSNNCGATIDCCSWEGIIDDGDYYAIVHPGAVHITNTHLRNDNGALPVHIQTGDASFSGGTTPGCIYSVGNSYFGVTDYIKVFDSSDCLCGTEYGQANLFQIFSFGDVGGQVGAIEKLRPVIGIPFETHAGGINKGPFGTTNIDTTTGGIAQTDQAWIIEPADFAGATTSKVIHLSNPVQTRFLIERVLVDVTTGFTGGGCTGVEVKVGTDSDDDAFLLSTAATGATVIGNASGELGVGLTTNLVQGAYWMNYPSGTAGIAVTITCSGGELQNLTAGKMYVRILARRHYNI